VKARPHNGDEMTKEPTHIRIFKDTKKRLDKRGNKNDSYDDIIQRILNEVEKD
jgi:hypothetical protein